MSRILKFRKKKMEFSREGFSSVGGEKEKVEKSYHTLVGNGLSLPRGLLSSNVNKIEEWVKSTLSSLNKSQFVAPNKKYITTIGSKAVSDKFALLPIYTQSSETNLSKTNPFLFSFFTPEKIKKLLSGIGKNNNRSFGKKEGQENNVGDVTVKGKQMKDTKNPISKEKKVGEPKHSSLKEGKVEEFKESDLKGKKGKGGEKKKKDLKN